MSSSWHLKLGTTLKTPLKMERTVLVQSAVEKHHWNEKIVSELMRGKSAVFELFAMFLDIGC